MLGQNNNKALFWGRSTGFNSMNVCCIVKKTPHHCSRIKPLCHHPLRLFLAFGIDEPLKRWHWSSVVGELAFLENLYHQVSSSYVVKLGSPALVFIKTRNRTVTTVQDSEWNRLISYQSHWDYCCLCLWGCCFSCDLRGRVYIYTWAHLQVQSQVWKQTPWTGATGSHA